MASDSCAGRAPLAAVSDNKKRSAEKEKLSAIKNNKSNDEHQLSPYKQRMKELEQCCEEHGKTLFYLFDSDELLWKTGKLRELGVDDEEKMTDEEREAAFDSLTLEQIDEHLKVMVVERKFIVLQRFFSMQIMYADPRNEEGDGVVMLNTYSSWCMYPVINQMLKEALKDVNAAKRRVQGADISQDTTDFAVEAFNTAFATVLACDAVNHWKEDSESPEDCQEIAKKVSKNCSDLLWFDDSELGFIDSYSRSVMLEKLESMDKDWSNIGGIKYKTVRNGQGLGRSHAPPPPPKKPRRTNAVPVVANTATKGSENEALVTFLNAVQGKKKKLRARTCLQLKIASVAEPEKSVLVVVSGMTNMKKMNQLCAYVTGHSYTFDYSSQRGMCIKGSRMELEFDGAKMWLAANGLSKQAAADGAALVQDKPVRIIQVFQGLNTSPSSGIVYDSNQARNVKVYWATPDNERYEITAQAIIANKCLAYDIHPMPRLVKHLENHNLDGYVPNLRTGFGKYLYLNNNYLQGDRNGPQYLVSSKLSEEEMDRIVENKRAEPIANEDGTVLNARKYGWSVQDVATAGLP